MMSYGLPQWLSGKESACSAGGTGDVGLVPGSGRSPEEGMAIHSSILACRVPGTVRLAHYSSYVCKELDMNEVTEHKLSPIMNIFSFLGTQTLK